jgi:ribosome assembly protein YihI (activator of Der GTPase)
MVAWQRLSSTGSRFGKNGETDQATPYDRDPRVESRFPKPQIVFEISNSLPELAQSPASVPFRQSLAEWRMSP